MRFYTRFIPDFFDKAHLREYARPNDINHLFSLECDDRQSLLSSCISRAEREFWGLKSVLMPPKSKNRQSPDKVKYYRTLDVLHLAFVKGYKALESTQKIEARTNVQLELTQSQVAKLQEKVRELEIQVRLATGDFSDYGIVTKQPKFAILSKDTIVTQASQYKSICGIYFLVKDDDIVYIGQSVNIFARLSGHKDKNFDSVTFIPCEKSELDIMESLYILIYELKLNDRVGNDRRTLTPLNLQQMIEKIKG